MGSSAREHSRQQAGAPHSIGGQFKQETTPPPAFIHVEVFVEDPPAPPSTSILIPTHQVEIAERSVAAANRRLERANITDRFELTVTAEPTEHNGTLYDTSRIELSQPRLSYDGWRFTGVHEQTEAGTFLSYGIPDDIEAVIPDDNRCDHCGHRRRRSRLFTVTNETTGETKQVGSNCIDSFLGVKPAGLWALEFDPEADLDVLEGDPSEWLPAVQHAEMHRGEDVLLAALRLSDSGENWVSNVRSTFTQPPTGKRVKDLLNTGMTEPATADEQTQLDEVLAWVDSIPADTDSDFLRNVKAALARTDDDVIAVRDKHVAIAAAAVVGWANEHHRQQRAQVAAEQKAQIRQEHLGTPGEKLTDLGRVTVVKATGYATTYGYTEIITFMDESGHLLKWRSASVPSSVTEGSTHMLDRATIKAHDEWQGNLETSILRPKLTPLDGATDGHNS